MGASTNTEHVITDIKEHSIVSLMHTKDISHLRRGLNAFGVESEQKYSPRWRKQAISKDASHAQAFSINDPMKLSSKHKTCVSDRIRLKLSSSFPHTPIA